MKQNGESSKRIVKTHPIHDSYTEQTMTEQKLVLKLSNLVDVGGPISDIILSADESIALEKGLK